MDVPDPSKSGVRLNEVTTTGPTFSVEIINITDEPVPLDGFRITSTGTVSGSRAFPSGTTLPPRGLLAVSASTLGFSPERGTICSCRLRVENRWSMPW